MRRVAGPHGDTRVTNQPPDRTDAAAHAPPDADSFDALLREHAELRRRWIAALRAGP